MIRVRYMHMMTSRDMMRLAPRSIMQLVGRLHFYLSFIVDNRHCCHRRRHLRAQTALLGTTCMLVRGDSNLQPSGWSVPPLPLHQHCLQVKNLRFIFQTWPFKYK